MRTNHADRFTTTLTASMGSTALTAAVASTAGISSPAYLVIDHDVAAKAEIILFDGTFTGTSFVTTNLANRYLAGSAAGSGITHDIGAKVISGPLSKLLADIYGEIDSALVPVGGIIMWSGSLGSIPANWQLCNGTNGTPDLRNRFIVGAGSTYAVGATGGADSVTLTTSQMPSHTHSGPSHTHGPGSLATNSAGSHGHDAFGRTTDGTSQDRFKSTGTTGGFTSSDAIQTAPSHSHSSLSGATSTGGTGSTGSAGSGSSHENRPPYYALAFIRRMA